jgi:hypothetical protein
MILKILLLIGCISIVSADKLNDTKSPQYVNTNGTTAKEVLLKLISNEKKSAGLRPYETSDLKLIRSINKLYGQNIAETTFYTNKSHSQYASSGAIIGKNGETNFKLVEDTHVIANTDKASN